MRVCLNTSEQTTGCKQDINSAPSPQHSKYLQTDYCVKKKKMRLWGYSHKTAVFFVESVIFLAEKLGLTNMFFSRLIISNQEEQ